MQQETNFSPETWKKLAELKSPADYGVASLGQVDAATQRKLLIKRSVGNLATEETLAGILGIKRHALLTTEEGRKFAEEILETLHLPILAHFRDEIYRDALLVTCNNISIAQRKEKFTITIDVVEWATRALKEGDKLDEDALRIDLDQKVKDDRFLLLSSYMNRGFTNKKKSLRELTIPIYFPGEKP